MGAKNIFNFSSFIIWYSIGKIYTYTISHFFSFKIKLIIIIHFEN
jgi:hypothetical protein